MSTNHFKYVQPGDKPIALVMLADTSGVPVNPGGAPAPGTATAVDTVETGLFTIAAGALAWTVVNKGTAPGTFNGITLEQEEGRSGPPLANGTTYTAYSGDATGTTFEIQRIA